MAGSRYFSGTSGLVLPYKNKSFYPPEFQEQSRLAYYSHLFNSIEINSSFYKIPQPLTTAKWAAIVPEDFRFTFKLWKEITHNKELLFDDSAVDTFMKSINAAGSKKGCLLIQFPPGFRFSGFEKLKRLLDSIQHHSQGNTWSVCVEFRHPSWYRPETYKLLNQSNTAMVIHDKTGSQAPMEDLDAPFVYLRFHGPSGNYRESYDDAFLSEYSSYIREWLDAGKEVYVYFNNTMGDAVKNLVTLNGYVRNTD